MPRHPHTAPATIAARLETETPVIAFTCASLLEQSASYREQIRGDNSLAATHRKFRDNLLSFLRTLHVDLESLLNTLPVPGKPPPEQVEKTATRAERFIGAAITGFKPIRFGSGSVVGKWITNELKPGAAANKLAEQIHPGPDAGE